MSSESLWRILLVEDNPADVHLWRLALKESGLNFELFVLLDGAEGLTFVQRQGKYSSAPRPDIAILDHLLPGNDGLEILAAIRSSQHLRSIPVVLITSLASPQSWAKAEALDVDRQIVKPFNLEEFIQLGAMVKELLMNRRFLPASGAASP